MTRVVSNIPLVGPLWNQIRQVKSVGRAIDSLKLRTRYGREIPDYVNLPNSGAKLFLDIDEPRGRGMIVDGAFGQPVLKEIWHQAVTLLQPAVVIDVGANYGEFIFGERYPDSTQIIGIEANSQLETFLTRSLEAHPDGGRMRLAIALAAGETSQEREFYVDAESSGRSSVVQRSGTASDAQTVMTVTVDELVDLSAAAAGGVVFKIDVEGFEFSVMEGMSRTLREASGVFGVMEFNSRLITMAGGDPDAFASWLGTEFHTAVLLKNQPFQMVADLTLEKIRELTGTSDVELDIALMSESQMVSVLEQACQA